ncbi:MAG: M3 family oligoendopeptidase [Patescibacteria group bacterium]|jgi:oligoendopeptidase F
MTKIRTEWDLNVFFQDLNDPAIEQNLRETEQKNYEFINKWKDRTDYLKDPKVLAEALKEYEVLGAVYGETGNAGYFLGLAQALDQANPNIKAKGEKIEEISDKITNDIKFFEERVSKIPLDDQAKFLSDPALRDFKHLLETMFASARYLLSESEEKILNIMGSTSYSRWVEMLSEFLSTEHADVKGKTRNIAELMDLLSDRDGKTRDEAAEKFNTILEKHVNTAEHELDAVLKFKKEIDKLRGFERPDSARHLADDMDSGTVDSLVESVKASFDISKRYYELKAKLMGVPKLKYHERNVQLGETDKKYSFEESFELVTKTLDGMDPTLQETVTQMLESGNVDVFPKEGKSDGAFCTHGLKSQPIFILLNLTGRLDDVVTFAHESGHAIHFELARRAQNSLNMDTSLATAEVASTFVEDFVLEKVFGEVEDEERLWLLMEKLNGLVSTIQRQIACYSFEMDLHKSFREIGYLPKEKIGELFSKNMADYMGDFVELSEGSQNWWVYWDHIRRYFYVYSYARGILISMSLQEMVREDAGNIEKIKGFLSAGSSQSPADIFKGLGIDIADKEFWAKGLDKQRALLDEAWKLAEKLGKL